VGGATTLMTAPHSLHRGSFPGATTCPFGHTIFFFSIFPPPLAVGGGNFQLLILACPQEADKQKTQLPMKSGLLSQSFYL
jgi:hypothetical protein